MAHAEATVVVNRPAGEVFDFLADGTNDPKWRDGVIEISRVSGDGLGTLYQQTMSGPGGRKIAGDYRITEFDRPRRLGFTVIAGPARPTGTFELQPDDAGTRVTFTMDLQPSGLMRLAAPMIARQLRKEVDAISGVKRVLEAS